MPLEYSPADERIWLGALGGPSRELLHSTPGRLENVMHWSGAVVPHCHHRCLPLRSALNSLLSQKVRNDSELKSCDQTLPM